MLMDFPDVLPEGWNWTLIWAACVIAVLLLVLVMAIAGAHPWADTTSQRISDYQHEQCETVKTSAPFVQVMNFWSNFAYLAAGLLIMSRSFFWFGKAIGIVLALLAFGSAWFHGTLTETGQTADMMGVYSALLAMIAYAVLKVFKISTSSIEGWAILGGSVVLGCFAGIFRTKTVVFDSDYFTIVLVAVLTVFMVAEAIRSIDWSQSGFIYFAWKADWVTVLLWTSIAVISGAVACLFKFTDGDKNLFARHDGIYSKCGYDPGSLFQGHGLWHILSAVMFVAIFEYIRATSTPAMWSEAS
jgi:hypothetical protein